MRGRRVVVHLNVTYSEMLLFAGNVKLKHAAQSVQESHFLCDVGLKLSNGQADTRQTNVNLTE